ncbi:PREDICTED: class II histocompatibility antigen, M alpha chain [Nanorana parkeri]|uniref:class II histocompatibility antigen, M alpha chain n=1 Tax=Nanorana parkeri TaxID=125878 RepID=UPI0008543855|nr:PREDICTED: class II histocompatibility antigen, M alpha chain [Nanorana parkeri]
MIPPDCGQPIRILCALLLVFPLLAVQAQQDTHLLSQVLFCQPSEPSSGLLKMFDEDQMFHYNFEEHSTSAWLSDFNQWSGQAFPSAENISSDLVFCKTFRENLTTALEDIMPEARGGTHVAVFTAHPLHIGVSNTLICAISDVYPPALTITWRKDGKVLSRELNSYRYFSLNDLSFQAFSYLNITPNYDETYSCDVQVGGDHRTIVSYWVPDFPVPSDVLENALCGLGFALGVVFLLVGFMFLCLSKKLHQLE